MVVSAQTETAFEIASGICWTLVYLLILWRGQKDHTYGMPLAALCANISWEFIFFALVPVKPPQYYVNMVWFGFDFFIVCQFLYFGRAQFKDVFPERYFLPIFVVSLVTAFFGVLTITYEFSDWIGKYSAFAQNLMMSILFIVMLMRRNSVSGQSMYIALLKMIGTLLPSILFFMLNPGAPFLIYLFITIFAFDLIYTVMLYNKLKACEINPWARI